jgi:F-type H+-transporting ATPase subunit epsilon
MQCDVVSVKESIYSGQVTMLIAKGAGGELGILPGHAPLVTLLQPGPIRVQLENGTEEIVYVSGGVLEVQPHVVTVLADTAIRADNLDEAAIMEARKQAEQLLSKSKE